jgi:hypothetical protein
VKSLAIVIGLFFSRKLLLLRFDRRPLVVSFVQHSALLLLVLLSLIAQIVNKLLILDLLYYVLSKPPHTVLVVFGPRALLCSRRHQNVLTILNVLPQQQLRRRRIISKNSLGIVLLHWAKSLIMLDGGFF